MAHQCAGEPIATYSRPVRTTFVSLINVDQSIDFCRVDELKPLTLAFHRTDPAPFGPADRQRPSCERERCAGAKSCRPIRALHRDKGHVRIRHGAHGMGADRPLMAFAQNWFH